jgi:hypothetical protein
MPARGRFLLSFDSARDHFPQRRASSNVTATFASGPGFTATGFPA